MGNTGEEGVGKLGLEGEEGSQGQVRGAEQCWNMSARGKRALSLLVLVLAACPHGLQEQWRGTVQVSGLVVSAVTCDYYLVNIWK